jgi:hypothetical protein
LEGEHIGNLIYFPVAHHGICGAQLPSTEKILLLYT